MKFPILVFANLLVSTLGRGLRAVDNDGPVALTEECLFLTADVQYDESSGKGKGPPEIFGCELANNKIVQLGGPGVPGLLKRKNELKSGESTIFVEGATIEDGILSLPNGKEIIIGKGKQRRNLAVTTGDKTFLVVRIVAADASTTASTAQLSDSVFGTSGDPFNLQSQYESCSNQKLNVMAADSSLHTAINDDGTITVTIPDAVTGVDDGVIRAAATSALQTKLGGSAPNSVVNHVLLCLPPGTSGSWIAYAYVNHWLSVYNNQWCTYPSALMHEIGHNLNLAHSGEVETYDDQSGMMGFSYSSDDGPVQCFNGPKSYQLGWYGTDTEAFDVSTGNSISRGIVGGAESSLAGDNRVVIRLTDSECSSTFDRYVSYNRKIGNNAGTREGGDQVLIHTKAGLPNSYAASVLLAKLSPGGQYTFASCSGIAYTITFPSITPGTPQVANVNIVGPLGPEPGCQSNSDCDWCNGETCNLGTGECEATFATPSCDDGNACTTDSCSNNQCVHALKADCCVADSECASGAGTCETFSCALNRCVYTELDNCCGNGRCEIGEDCTSCNSDCPRGVEKAVCGDGVCDTGKGEDCLSCPQDCAGETKGNPNGRFCCGQGTPCSDWRCGSKCSIDQGATTCCGDFKCEGSETADMCPMDSCGVNPTTTTTTFITTSATTTGSCKGFKDWCQSGSECCSGTCERKGKNWRCA